MHFLIVLLLLSFVFAKEPKFGLCTLTPQQTCTTGTTGEVIEEEQLDIQVECSWNGGPFVKVELVGDCPYTSYPLWFETYYLKDGSVLQTVAKGSAVASTPALENTLKVIRAYLLEEGEGADIICADNPQDSTCTPQDLTEAQCPSYGYISCKDSECDKYSAYTLWNDVRSGVFTTYAGQQVAESFNSSSYERVYKVDMCKLSQDCSKNPSSCPVPVEEEPAQDTPQQVSSSDTSLQECTNPVFFAGFRKDCRAGGLTVLGASCCGISGWFSDMCSNSEKELKKRREAGTCKEIGTYCSKKVLGVCIEKKRSFCCFNSQLARILQESCFRPQLGRGWGSPKNPDCGGIALSDFQRVDLGNPDCVRAIEDWISQRAQSFQERLNNMNPTQKSLEAVQTWFQKVSK
ncbi:MAG: conjugal transfer protein TraN [Aquificaceae bacterium]